MSNIIIISQAQKRNRQPHMTDHFIDWPNNTLASAINQMGPPRTEQETRAQRTRTSMTLKGKTFPDGSWYNKMYFYGPNLEFLGTLKVQREKVIDSNPPVYTDGGDKLVFTHKDFKIPRIIFPYTKEGANKMYNAFLQDATKLFFVDTFRKIRTSPRDFRPHGEEYDSDEARKKYQRQQLYRRKRQQQKKAAAAAAGASAPPPAVPAPPAPPAVPAAPAIPVPPAVPAAVPSVPRLSVQRKQTKASVAAPVPRPAAPPATPVISNSTPSYTSGKIGTPRRWF